MESFWPAIIIVGIMSWFMGRQVIADDYSNKLKLADSVVENYTGIVSKTGIFCEETYEEMQEKLERMGEFEIYIWAEKYEYGIMSERIEGSKIIDLDLRNNDFDTINIFAESKNIHPISFFYNHTFFGDTGANTELKIWANASDFIQ